VTTEAKVGAFVLGCFAVLAFTLIYLINAQLGLHTVPYCTYLRYAGGLEPGTSVLFGGIDVGKVTAVRPAASDPTRIEILLNVKDNTPLNEKSIAKQTSPEQIGFYAYHRWAIDPRDLVTNAIIERLRASGTFARVQTYNGSRDVDYVLSGRLEKLDEIDDQGGTKVEVAITAEMTSIATGAVVWSNAVSEVGDVGKRDVPAVVSEMNRAMQRAIEKLLNPLSTGWSAGSLDGRKN
jgi:ABC-type uncharacterized transport system auxiliary subunit